MPGSNAPNVSPAALAAAKEKIALPPTNLPIFPIGELIALPTSLPALPTNLPALDHPLAPFDAALAPLAAAELPLPAPTGAVVVPNPDGPLPDPNDAGRGIRAFRGSAPVYPLGPLPEPKLPPRPLGVTPGRPPPPPPLGGVGDGDADPLPGTNLRVGGPLRLGVVEVLLGGAGGVSGIGPPGDGLVPPPLYGGVSGVVLGDGRDVDVLRPRSKASRALLYWFRKASDVERPPSQELYVGKFATTSTYPSCT